MDAFELIRENAAGLHAELVAKGHTASRPLDFVAAAAGHLTLELDWVHEGDAVLKGARAFFDEQSGVICCAEVADEGIRAGLVAHEIGHARIHAVSSECREPDIDPTRSTEAAPVGLQRVEDYGARERRELQADVFAREFLLPRSVAKAAYLAGATASSIACDWSLPINLVRQQLFDALLLPPYIKEEAKSYIKRENPSQDRAAAHRASPFLLQAGPGTGKTSTLVARVLSLLAEGVDPSAILVLTYSNRAAGELSGRLTAAVPEAAELWIGTFHAFGLDLIRRHYDKLSLPPDPALFDRSDAIEVLEEILPTLSLVHYRNLWDPAMELREIVNAISRAKDELVSPDRYRELAQRAKDNASDTKDREDAEKALEVAEVYALYEKTLHERRAVDFGDLIMRPTLLLESDSLVAETVRLRHRHVLVDEYQDVNRASAKLLKVLAGDANRLWVVGDARQSIYRFRGASSANMANFSIDYPNAFIDRLEMNYRSTDDIKDVFQAVAPHMAASRGTLPLQLTTLAAASGVKPTLRSFDNLDDEIAGIAANVRSLEAQGVILRDQAVLCRTNKRLNEIASGLEARGIAVLHLGSLFERDEIRDLLSVLALLVDPFGSSLVRLCANDRYAIPLQDVYAVLRFFKNEPGKVISRLPDAAAGLSAEGKTGIGRLAADLKGIRSDASAWEILSAYLLDATRLPANLGTSDSVQDHMRAVAIWQFVNFVRDQPHIGRGNPIQMLLNRARSMVLLAEERDLRQVPPSALHMNAVRLMTVHGSKGLEFDAVHLPGMTVSSFPSSWRGQRCPPPRGLIEGTEGRSPSEVGKAAHEEEEQCLFFVALSRAKRHLLLSKSQTQPGGGNRKPSPYLEWLKPGLIAEVANPELMPLPPCAPTPKPIEVEWSADWKLTHPKVGQFEKCPRRFFYTHVLGVGGARKQTPFSQTHDCLYGFMEWLAEARLKGPIDAAQAAVELNRLWDMDGPKGHAFAADYRALAESMMAVLLRSVEGRKFQAVEELTVTLPGGRIVVLPDAVSVGAGGRITLHRVRTGSKRSDEYDELDYTLYHLAAQTKYGAGYTIEALHLSDDLAEEVNAARLSAAKIATRRTKSSDLTARIRAGSFPADPDPVRCPRCPHFFICDAVSGGALKQS